MHAGLLIFKRWHIQRLLEIVAKNTPIVEERWRPETNDFALRVEAYAKNCKDEIAKYEAAPYLDGFSHVEDWANGIWLRIAMNTYTYEDADRRYASMRGEVWTPSRRKKDLWRRHTLYLA